MWLRRNWGQIVAVPQGIPGRQTREKEVQVRWTIFSLLNKLTIKHSCRKACVWTIWSRQDSQCKSVKVHCFHYIADGLHQLKSCPLSIISLDRGGKTIRLHALLIANETAIKTISNRISKLSGSFFKTARSWTLLPPPREVLIALGGRLQQIQHCQTQKRFNIGEMLIGL